VQSAVGGFAYHYAEH